MDTKLTLRAPEPSDLEMLYRLENLPDVWDASWPDAPVSRQMLADYLIGYSADIARDHQLRLIAQVGGEAVGAVDIYDYSASNSRAMVGIAVLPEWRGKGYGSEMLRQAAEYCRVRLSLHQLCAFVARDNEPSLRLFDAAGFKTSGCLRSWLKRANAYEDAIILQLLFK